MYRADICAGCSFQQLQLIWPDVSFDLLFMNAAGTAKRCSLLQKVFYFHDLYTVCQDAAEIKHITID